jgi:hypothetical protein
MGYGTCPEEQRSLLDGLCGRVETPACLTLGARLQVIMMSYEEKRNLGLFHEAGKVKS